MHPVLQETPELMQPALWNGAAFTCMEAGTDMRIGYSQKRKPYLVEAAQPRKRSGSVRAYRRCHLVALDYVYQGAVDFFTSFS